MKAFYNLRGYFVNKVFTSKHPLIFRIVTKVFDLILDVYDRIKYRKFFKRTKLILRMLDDEEYICRVISKTTLETNKVITDLKTVMNKACENDRYCGECANIVGTPIGCYCILTGKNLDRESDYSHNKNDRELLQHCNGKFKKG